MDRACRFVGTSHPRYKTGDIIEIRVGGDNNRKFNHTDAQWEALKIARLDTLKQNALNLDYFFLNHLTHKVLRELFT